MDLQNRKSLCWGAAVLAAGIGVWGCDTPPSSSRAEPKMVKLGKPRSQKGAKADRDRRAGRYDEAIAGFEAALAEPMDDKAAEADTRHRLALAYWSRADQSAGGGQADRAAAIDQASRAQQIVDSPGGDAPEELAWGIGRTLGRFLLVSGRNDEAIAQYQKTLSGRKAEPVETAWARYELGNAYLGRAMAAGATAGGSDLSSAQREYSAALSSLQGAADHPADLEASVYNSMGLVHQLRGEQSEAADRFAQADKVLKSAGMEGLRARVLANLLTALVEAGRLDEVRGPYEELKGNSAGRSDPRALAALGLAALQLGRFEESAEHFDLAKYQAKRNPAVSSDATFMAQLAVNAASCAQSVGDFEEAERNLTQASKELKSGGVAPRTRAIVLANLGRMYLTLERLDDAEKQLEEVRRITAGASGADAALIELDLANLARLRGHLNTATLHCQQALQGLKAAQGPDSPSVAHARLELASIYREQGRCDQAINEAQAAMQTLDSRLGKEHKDAVVACLKTALIVADCGETPAGAALFDRLESEARERFLAMRKQLGARNVEVLRALVYFADMNAHTPAAYKQALKQYEEAEEAFSSLWGEETPSIAAVRLKEGQLLEKLDRDNDAFRVYDRGQRRMGSNLKDHPIRGEFLAAMGDLQSKNGKQEEARKLWAEAYRIKRQAYGADDPRVKQFLEERKQ